MNDRSGRVITGCLAAVAIFTCLTTSAHAQNAVSFEKTFSPNTIGPGSTSALVFTINSNIAQPATDLAFSDTLPAALTIANPTGATNTCDGTLTAPAGGATISLMGGSVGANDSCEIVVNVTGTSPGVHLNVSGDLTSSAGNSGTATADLEIATDRPGFSKSFSPTTVQFGGKSELTFTIDNTVNANTALFLQFSDNLPAGLAVAGPANLSTTCPITFNGSITANPGGDSIAYSAGSGTPGLAAGATCTLSVDVVAESVGRFDNRSGELMSSDGGSFTSSGFAVAALEANADELALTKSFTDDPVPPGDTTTLRFSVTNFSRNDGATGIGFTDDLDATLSGLSAVPPLPTDPCGAGSQVTGTSLVTLTGGNLGPAETCSFDLTVQVPAGATPGTYLNTTSSVTGDIGGVSTTGSPASDDLFVQNAPTLTKTFIDPVVGAGATATFEFTITNTSSTSSATDISFSDDLGAFLSGASVNTLPANDFCGAGSTIFPTTNNGSLTLNVSGANLASADSCTFSVVIDVPTGTPSNTYTNTTSEITATVDGESVAGTPATDSLAVVSAPSVGKEFIDDPVDPGDTVTLQFTMSHDEFAPNDATNISFTDDLSATLSSLSAVSLPTDPCGAGSQITGTTNLTLSGGTLAPGESCSFPVTLQVPAGAVPGIYTNTTSEVTATVSGIVASNNPANDDLLISGLVASKEFLESPALPGQTITLRFTLDNDNPTLDATDIFFTDNLGAVISGMSATGLPQNDVCGTGSSLSSSGSTLILTGGILAAGTSCTFDVSVQVPAGAANGSYVNTTSSVTATYDGNSVTFPPASGELEVSNETIALSKSFTDDPVAPGDNVTLQFELSNLSDTETVSNITFSDDLDAVLSGLASTSGSLNDVCGTGSQIAGTGVVTLTNGSLAPGASCTFSVSLSVPLAVPGGSNFINTTSSASGQANGVAVIGSPATDTLNINLLSFDIAFDSLSVAGGTVGLIVTIENTGADPVNSLAFTNDLDAVIPGLVATGLPQSNICGTGSSIGGTSLLVFSGGELAPGASCTFPVTLSVPPDAFAGSYIDTTSGLTSGGLSVAEPASASLGIEPPPTFAKVFTPNAIAVGGVSTLTFTIDNSASVLAASSLAFTDNLPAGLQVAASPNAGGTCGGTVTATPGSGVIALSGGSVAAGATCSLSVDTTGTAEGTLNNVSGDLTSSNGSSGTASDTLTVVGDEFALDKSFRTAPVLPGGLVEMELSIVNGSAFPLTDIALTDDLGAVFPGLAAEGLPLSDVCGTGSQVSGTGVVSLTGGNLPAGSSCTIVVPVRVPSGAPAGTLTNTTGTATGTREGVAVEAPADSADIEVAPAQFSKSLNPSVTGAGSNVTLTFTLSNPDPANVVDNVQFTDDLDAFISGMTAIGTPLNGICGAGSVLSGGATLSLTGGTLPAGGSCNFQVQASVPGTTAAGTYTNTTSDIDGDIDGNAVVVDAASADLEIESTPLFTKAFSPSAVGANVATTLTLTIDNSAASIAADDLAFVDVLPAPMVIATPANASSNCGGTLNASPGAGQIDLTGGSASDGGTCQVQVDVTTSQLGTSTNTTGDLTSTLGNSGTATADLVVDGSPAFTKAFSPAAVGPGQPTTLVFTIDNSANSAPADSLAFTDPLPQGMTVTSNPSASNTCGGTLSAAPGSGTVGLTNGSVVGGSVCTIQVDVISTVFGVRTNVTDDLTSSLGNSGSAVGSLTQSIAVPTLDRHWIALLLLLLMLTAWMRVRTV